MTTVLIVLDGWGHNDSPQHNAIYQAHSPTWDQLWQQQSHALISGSGLDVGLPEGQMGNSEVGHMTLGAGRIVWQNLSRINLAIDDGSFFDNSAYIKAIDATIDDDKALHIMGLLSDGGVHSHTDHIKTMIEMAAQRGCQKVYLHAFLDGRDTAPRSAEQPIQAIEQLFKQTGCGAIASIIGRYYAMDRDNRWDRIQQAYQLIAQGKPAYKATSATEALQRAYSRNENDEFVKASQIGDGATINDGDSVIFMNFRSDRARQISRALTEESFNGFDRQTLPAIKHFVTTTEYSDDINADIAFGKSALHNNFGEYIASLNKTQLRIAETEKYAHVTFFFSGGQEQTFHGEDRLLIPSPSVATYDLQPQMSAPELTDKLVEAIESQRYDAIICNYANGDMVGHTGNFEAAVKAVEAVDQCLARIITALDNSNSHCLITADHGNVEKMLDVDSGQALTSHTSEPVPLIYYGPSSLTLEEGGTLADIAPTLLHLMQLSQPEEMTGRNLIS